MKVKSATPVDIFSLTDQGDALAVRLQMLMPGASRHHRPKPFIEIAQSSFRSGHRCIFICSTGIVIRALAPVLRDKYRDPAVIVIDQSGNYVIPLLSGHEGGAVAFAHDIAQAISAQCVVTSAMDYSRPIYTIGMGCERGCPLAFLQPLFEQVCREMDAAVTDSAVTDSAVTYSGLASIDLKADEAGLLELSKSLNLELHLFSAIELRQVEHLLSEKSEIVFKEVGCYGVAEAAALCCATKLTGMPAELALPKQKNARATIAVARSYAP
ncbi:cobalamin biosynthesis protein [Candidatus Spongiihabitans sp.]|uniref:cobalamin biosynthesis protein n=1 Tax=Candidatus Spongiihabitans sp. TaxID=3101308 RepID=UPI003C7E2B58